MSEVDSVASLNDLSYRYVIHGGQKVAGGARPLPACILVWSSVHARYRFPLNLLLTIPMPGLQQYKFTIAGRLSALLR